MDRSKMMDMTQIVAVASPTCACTIADTATDSLLAASASTSLIPVSVLVASTTAAKLDVASTSADEALASATHMMLTDSKHTAANFNAAQVPVSTFMFAGLDYEAVPVRAGKDGLRDIAMQVGGESKACNMTRKVRLCSCLRARVDYICKRIAQPHKQRLKGRYFWYQIHPLIFEDCMSFMFG